MGKMGRATKYHEDDIYDIIAPSASSGYYQIFALKSAASEVFIDKKTPLKIGDYEFIPGQKYSEFGSTKKTSAGFISYKGEPLTFVGTYKNNALFVDDRGPMYDVCGNPLSYWSWRFNIEFAIFIATTHQCAGRVMEMRDAPPRRKKSRGRVASNDGKHVCQGGRSARTQEDDGPSPR